MVQSQEIKQIHRQLAIALYKKLLIEYVPNCIACDQYTGNGTYIDMVCKTGNKFILYEIKTYNDLRKNIREALGQLLEYAYWHTDIPVKELVIVTQQRLDIKAEAYLNHLHENFSFQ